MNFQALLNDQNADEPQTMSVPFDIQYIHTRIMNFGPTTTLKNLKANSYGKRMHSSHSNVLHSIYMYKVQLVYFVTFMICSAKIVALSWPLGKVGSEVPGTFLFIYDQ